jgi:hypothetical protein
MKKFLIILGALFLMILVVGGIDFAILAYRGNALDKESRVYADTTLSAIVTQWSEKALLDRASPEFKQATTIDQLDAYFRSCSQLGALQHADSMRGQAGIFYDTKRGKMITGQYSTKVQFENAEATITLGLIKHGEQWQILKFDVQAPGFRPRPSPSQTMQPIAGWRMASLLMTKTRSCQITLALTSGG